MRITGDNDEGKAQLDNFIDPEIPYPVVACTSRLMSTGVDAQTCHVWTVVVYVAVCADNSLRDDPRISVQGSNECVDIGTVSRAKPIGGSIAQINA
jgi:hypothetical protein